MVVRMTWVRVRRIVPSVPPLPGGSCRCNTRIPHEFGRHHSRIIRGFLDAILRWCLYSEGVILGAYHFDPYRKPEDAPGEVEDLLLLATDGRDGVALRRGRSPRRDRVYLGV